MIKGIPAVHPEDETHVGHITVEVGTGKTAKIRERLLKLGIKPREDVPCSKAEQGNETDQVKRAQIRKNPTESYIYISMLGCEICTVLHFS